MVIPPVELMSLKLKLPCAYIGVAAATLNSVIASFFILVGFGLVARIKDWGLLVHVESMGPATGIGKGI